MVHLCIHLPYQVILTGPVHYTWMFSTERQLGAYKKDADNKYRVEANIAERHLVHESVNFSKRYVQQDAVVPPVSNWNISVVCPKVRPVGAVQQASFTPLQREMLHWCVLQECEEAMEYLSGHRELFLHMNPHLADNELQIRRSAMDDFEKWLKCKKTEGHNISTELLLISQKPQHINVYSQCDVNGVRYISYYRDQLRRTQNHGVYISGEEGFDYYGSLISVIELLYSYRMPVVLFYCKWFDNSPGSVKIDRGFISVDTNTSCYEDCPYMMAMNASQVFYIDDPLASEGYKVVNVVQQRGTYSEASLAFTDSTDPSYEVQDPYQEDEVISVPITELFIDLGYVPHVNVTEYSDDGSDEDQNSSNDEVEDGFNNDICSDTEEDDVVEADEDDDDD